MPAWGSRLEEKGGPNSRNSLKENVWIGMGSSIKKWYWIWQEQQLLPAPLLCYSLRSNCRCGRGNNLKEKGRLEGEAALNKTGGSGRSSSLTE